MHIENEDVAWKRLKRYLIACAFAVVFANATLILLTQIYDRVDYMAVMMGLLALGMATASVVYQMSTT